MLIVLVAGIIPHHHHDNKPICFHSTHAENHHHESDDDKHHSTHNNSHDPSCITATTLYSNIDGKIKIKEPSSENGNNIPYTYFGSLPLPTSTYQIQPLFNPYNKPKPGEYLLFYTSTEVSGIHGLRAPPYFLS